MPIVYFGLTGAFLSLSFIRYFMVSYFYMGFFGGISVYNGRVD